MQTLELTIDLPKSAYSITDKPNVAQRLTEAAMTLFSSVLLILATIGWAMIYAVNGVGNGLERSIDALYNLYDKTCAGRSRSGQIYEALCTSWATIDGWTITALAALVSVVLARGVVYAA